MSPDTILTADGVSIDPVDTWVYTYGDFSTDGQAIRTRLQFDNETRVWRLKTFFGDVPFFATYEGVAAYITEREKELKTQDSS